MGKTNKFMTGISITHEEKAIVDGLKEQRGTGSFSLALGMIIREWAEMKKQYVTVPIKGAVIEDGKITIAEELARR